MRLEVTTPGKIPEEIRDVPASVYLIGREEIEVFGYDSLTEIFEHVPGFYNIDNNNGISGNFGVRGFWNGRSQNGSVAILINGIPQSRMDSWSHPMETLNVPVEAIDRVEISRGPNSVIYGNGAAFGAINIITDESFAEDQVTVSYGSLNTKKTALRWSEFGEDYHVMFNAGWGDTDGLDHDLTRMVGPSNRPLLPAFGVTAENSSLAGKLEQDFGYAQLAGAWRNLYFDYSVNNANVEHFSGFPSVEGGNQRKVDSYIATVGYDAPLFDAVSLDTRVSYGSFSVEQTFDALRPDFIGVNDRAYNSWELESLLAFTPSDDFHFVGGVNWERMQNYFEYTHVPELGLVNEYVRIDDRDIQAVFGQFTYRFLKPLTLVAGYRLEQLKDFDRSITIDDDPPFAGVSRGYKNGTPRVSLIYQPTESQVIKLMAGDASKIPSFPSILVEPEHIRTVELNYTITSERSSVSASVFRNSLSDLLIDELIIGPGGNVEFKWRAGGRVESLGLELLGRRDYGDHVRLELGATWQDSESDYHPEEVLSYSPELVAHGKVRYKAGDFSAAATGRYVSSMYSFFNSDSSQPSPNSDGYFGAPVDGYFVMDLNARWDNVWRNVFVSLRLANVFDTEIWYPNNPINGFLIDRGHLGYGRTVRLEAGLRF